MIARATLLAFVQLTADCIGESEAATEQAPHEQQPFIEREAVAPAEPTSYVGVVVPRASIDVGSPVGGKLEELPFAVGERVVAGDVIARLSNIDLVHRLRLARSASASARSNVKRSRHERRRAADRRTQTERLGAYVSGEEQAEAVFEVERSDALVGSELGELGERQAEAARLHALVDALTVRADFAGVVAVHYEDPGQILAPEAPLVRLISERTLLRFAMPHSEADTLAIGSEIVFIPDGAGERITCRVFAVAPEVDAASMILVEAELDAPSAVATGVSGRVEIPGTARD